VSAVFIARNLSKIKKTAEWKKLEIENPSALVPVFKEIS
jgi:hypothetical protein